MQATQFVQPRLLATLVFPSMQTRTDQNNKTHKVQHCCRIHQVAKWNSKGKPAIAQLVEHLNAGICSDQMVPGSIPGGRTFSQFACIAVSELVIANARTCKPTTCPPPASRMCMSATNCFALGFRTCDHTMRNGKLHRAAGNGGRAFPATKLLLKLPM